jgi:hypothetical protein
VIHATYEDPSLLGPGHARQNTKALNQLPIVVKERLDAIYDYRSVSTANRGPRNARRLALEEMGSKLMYKVLS